MLTAGLRPSAEAEAELRGPDRPLTMEDMVGVVGRLRHVELALFAWLGRIAPALSSPSEAVWASGASLRAAWRAAQLEQLLPVSVGAPRAGDTTAALGPELAGCLGAFESCTPPSEPGQATSLAAAWQAALLLAYTGRLRQLSTAADGPLERVLERLVADLEAAGNPPRAARQDPGRGA